jgi:apolipoprotein N-acyltransferase
VMLQELPSRTDRRGTLAQLGVASLSGVLWFLAAPPFDLWPLAWIAMLPLVWLWSHVKTARRAGWLGGATGLVMCALGFHWFAGLMHQHAGLPWPVAILALLLLSAWQALPLVLAGRAVWWIRRWKRLPMALVAPACVVAVEYAWPVVFPYQLAVTQSSFLPAIQIADLFGASLITGLLIAVPGAITDLMIRRRRPAMIVAGLVAASFAYGVWREHDIDERRAAAPHARIGLVQPNEAMHVDRAPDSMAEQERLRTMRAATADLEAQGAQLVIWSETAFPATLPRDLAHDIVRGSPWRLRDGFVGPLVFGATTADDRDHWNSAILLEGERFVARDDKIHRVLGSEWDPLVEWFPSLEGTLPRGYAGGAAPMILPVGPLRLGVLICLEDTLPGYAREVGAERPNLLVNMTIDTWFGSFAEPWQHRALAVLRAVEERSDLVRAVNTGPSGLVEASGRIGPQTPVRSGDDARVEGVLVDVAVMEAGHTLYGVVGDTLPRLCLLLMLGGWIGARLARRREKVEQRAEARHEDEQRAKRKKRRR